MAYKRLQRTATVGTSSICGCIRYWKSVCKHIACSTELLSTLVVPLVALPEEEEEGLHCLLVSVGIYVSAFM
jgi:hypothetical protein